MSSDNKNVPIDYNVKEIIDNLDKKKILTPEDKKRIEESLNFKAAIEKIDISDNSNRVIFTDGEFFLVSSTDSQKSRKKKKREEARNMYIEYFIKYQLNPIIKQRENDELARTISVEPQRENLKEKDVKKTLDKDVKKIADNESKTIPARSKEEKTKQKLR